MPNLNFYTTIKSPVGEIVLISDGIYLNAVYINYFNLSINEILKKLFIADSVQLAYKEEQIVPISKLVEKDNNIGKFKSINYKPEIFNEAIMQLNEYFTGKRKIFTLAIKQKCTEFQKLVWEKLQNIDYGKTISYKELASLSGNNSAYRAAANAVSKNRINIIVPCHRVISVKGELRGYNCGPDIKRRLLLHEQIYS